MTEEISRPTPTADDIKDALNRTGFLLEYRVAQSLRQRKFSVSISQAYPDPETGKSREIDVFADIGRDARRQPVDISITAELIIECKNSSGPFVLIGDHGEDYVGIDDAVVLSFDPLRLDFPKALHKAVEYELKLDHLPGAPVKDDFTGYQLLRVNRQNNTWKADNNAVYDSILYPLAKALFHRLDVQNEDDEDLEDEWKYPFLTYLFPIIVTSGQVFTVDVTSGEPEVSEAKWARVKRSFHSHERNADLRADLVSFKYWEEYIDSRVIKIVDSAQDVLAKNIHLFDPEWLLSNLGEPEGEDNKAYFHEWLNGVREQRNRK